MGCEALLGCCRPESAGPPVQRSRGGGRGGGYGGSRGRSSNEGWTSGSDGGYDSNKGDSAPLEW